MPPETLVPLLVGAAVLLLVYAAAVMGREASLEGVMPPEEEFRTLPVAIRLLYPFTRPIGLRIRDTTAEIEVARGADAADHFLVASQNRLLRLLITAGRPGGVEPPEFIGLMVVGAFLGAAVAAALAISSGFLPELLIPGGAFCGFFLPYSWLRDRARERQKKIRRTLPYALDLLALSVEAGLDFTQALANIVRKLGRVPLAQEFAQALREIQVGQTRAQSLRDCAYRIDLLEFTSFASALIQADELGASLGPILRIQSDQLRERRYQAAEKQAMEAPVKIIFPLVAFIFPVTLGIILFPIFLKILPQLLQAGLGK